LEIQIQAYAVPYRKVWPRESMIYKERIEIETKYTGKYRVQPNSWVNN